jgi:hypothetical protein
MYFVASTKNLIPHAATKKFSNWRAEPTFAKKWPQLSTERCDKSLYLVSVRRLFASSHHRRHRQATAGTRWRFLMQAYFVIHYQPVKHPVLDIR